MNATLIQDTFKYFAKFPSLAGVLKNFNRPPAADGYDTLKASIAALNPNSLIAGLEDYVFGSDMLSIKKRIENATGIYLFVDYGNISDYLEGTARVETGEFTIGVTIARKMIDDNLDQVEQVLLADLTLGMITQLKDFARADARTVSFVKYLTLPVDITPWFAPDLFSSMGWTMTFKVKGASLI